MLQFARYIGIDYVNPFTGTHKAGNHAFRRFRNTYLRNET